MARSKIKPYIMILPVVLLIGLFIYALINTLIQSFGILPAAGLNDLTLSYYQAVLLRRDLLPSLLLSLYFALVSSLVAVFVGVFISAIAVNSGFTKKKTFQLLKIPIIVPHMVAALLVINVFSQSGIIARFFYLVNIVQHQQQFPLLLFDKNAVGIMLAYLWKEIPFVILMVITLMEKIDVSLGEAAQNLGASKLKAFYSITLPLCFPAVLTSFIVIFAYSFGAYEIPFLLGTTAPKALPVLTYVEYIHPDLAHRPYAMALNGIMVVLSVFLSYIYYHILKGDRIGDRQAGAGVENH
ncbi:ABC transporter permease [Desulfitobacterium sp. AusDCA]|uniref:ABC transporter permease n=1 Tax=Desulfitobacterium sp. AusDCA TaxID=3240383 RepID=UPI003DA79586